MTTYAEKRISLDPHPYDPGCGVADSDDDGEYLTHCRTRVDAERLKDRILANWDRYETARSDVEPYAVNEFIEEMEGDDDVQDALHGRTL